MSAIDHSQTIGYLSAKKSVDDRALNNQVWRALWEQMPPAPHRVLELGAGIGTMIERLLEHGKLSRASYTAVDLEAELLEEASRRLRGWAAENSVATKGSQQALTLTGPDLHMTVELKQGDVTGSLREQVGDGYDLLIGNALMDLVEIPEVLPKLLKLIEPAGLYYFSITFDGVSHFEPVIDRRLDEKIIQNYHRTMDERTYRGRSAGHSQSGRLLLSELTKLGADIVAAGGSDWIVYPTNGRYRAKEAEFLSAILNTIEQALRQQGNLDPAQLERWLRQRRQQLVAGELIYLTHQIDVCGHPPPAAEAS